MENSHDGKEDVNKNKDVATAGQDGEVDAMSFASILAGVERMRNRYIDSQPTKDQEQVTHDGTPTSRVSEKERITPVHSPPIQKEPAKPLTSRPPRQIVEPNHNVDSSKLVPVERSSKSTIRSVRAGNITRNTGPQDILVNKTQTGNPLLKDSMMKITPWKFDTTILSDYYINSTLQIIFLSLKYHKLKPEYIWQRLKKLNKGSSIDTANDSLRVLLTVVDIDSHQEILRKLSDFCIKHDLSLILSWSFEEAGNYIALAKQLYNAPMKSIASIRGIKPTDYNSLITDSLTQIRSVNKTDVSNLLANYKSLQNIVKQSCKLDSNLLEINGLGTTKVNHMKRVFSEPFIYNKKYKNHQD